MNSKRTLIAASFTALLIIATGCSKSDQNLAGESTTTDSSATGAISSAANDLKQNAAEAADKVKDAANNAVENTKQAAQNFTAETNSKVESAKAEAQSLIDKTRTYISEKKYEDALASLKQLSNFSLTPEQKKTVDGLKTQLQNLMTNTGFTNAASAVGNLFKK
jgi:hypothetical protein